MKKFVLSMMFWILSSIIFESLCKIGDPQLWTAFFYTAQALFIYMLIKLTKSLILSDKYNKLFNIAFIYLYIRFAYEISMLFKIIVDSTLNIILWDVISMITFLTITVIYLNIDHDETWTKNIRVVDNKHSLRCYIRIVHSFFCKSLHC